MMGQIGFFSELQLFEIPNFDLGHPVLPMNKKVLQIVSLGKAAKQLFWRVNIHQILYKKLTIEYFMKGIFAFSSWLNNPFAHH